MNAKSDIDIRKLIRRAYRESGRNTLALFMTDHFSDLQQELGDRVDWHTLTRFFAEQGLKDACGKSPSMITARQTWYRVRRREMEKQQAAQRVVTPRVNFPGVVPISPPVCKDKSFLASSGSECLNGGKPSPEVPTTSESAGEKIRRAQEAILAGQLPLPPQVRPYDRDDSSSR